MLFLLSSTFDDLLPTIILRINGEFLRKISRARCWLRKKNRCERC